MYDRIDRGVRYVSVLLLAAMLLALSPAAASGAPQRTYTYDGSLENVVVDWNRHAVEALSNAATGEPAGAGQPPPICSLYLAMMHGTVYGVVLAIDQHQQTYLPGLPVAPRSASKAAAVATAAHDVLVGVVLPTPLSPAILDRLHAARDATLAAATAADGAAAVANGVAVGKAGAAVMLAARANDGRYGPYRWEESTEAGRFRFKPGDAPANASRFDWVSQVKPFLIESASQFRTQGPNALTSDAYAKEYAEVKALGSKTGSTRTPAQEALAQFYNLNPVELHFRAFRTLAVDKKLTLVEQARLFAMLSLGGADSLITCWADKAQWLFWRPSTAIQNGENDGNAQTVGDPAWAAMLPDPPYPDHSSGFNCVTAAYMYAARAFFGTDEMAYSVVKVAAGAPNVTRTYTRFSDVIVDAIDVRVYHGVHFRAADVQGAQIGQHVAEWQFQRYFQPVAAMPGLPNTGVGSGTERPSSGWLLLGLGGALALGWGLRRKQRAA